MPKTKKEDDLTKKSSSTKKSTTKKTATKTAAKKTATKTAAKKTTKKTEIKSDKSTVKKVEISDDGFNWTEFEEGIQTISKKQIDEFDKLIDDNFVGFTNSIIFIIWIRYISYCGTCNIWFNYCNNRISFARKSQ